MMKAYRVEKQIAANGELKLSALPFWSVLTSNGISVAVVLKQRQRIRIFPYLRL